MREISPETSDIIKQFKFDTEISTKAIHHAHQGRRNSMPQLLTLENNETLSIVNIKNI